MCFRRTLVGLKRLSPWFYLDFNESFQKDPRWVEADMDIADTKRVAKFQKDPRWVEAGTDGP